MATLDTPAWVVRVWVQSYRDLVHRCDSGEITWAQGEYRHDWTGLMSDGQGRPTGWASLPPIMSPADDHRAIPSTSRTWRGRANCRRV